MDERLEKRFEEIESIAKAKGLDFFPVVYEEVPREVIWDVASYGLPTRMSHWSFGRSYVHQKYYGEMGSSKIYELVLNNDPSFAFLDLTNPDVVNMLVCAHVCAHSDFFKNNVCFSRTNRNMVNQAERNAKTIDLYKNKFQIDVVEDWMDVGFALDAHIDWRLGEDRQRYPEPEMVQKVINPLPFSDIHGDDDKPRVKRYIKNSQFPPFKERDLLFFLVNYAQMLPWQREVLNIIRSEAYYFAPQFLTKIMNEGWASYWHAQIMYEYDGISPEEHLDFAKAHASVVSPGWNGGFNPYYVGFRIFKDIEERWDEAFKKGQADSQFMSSPEVERYDDKGNLVMSKANGRQKMFQVRAEDDDISFIMNYLTDDLIEDMELFTYGLRGKTDEPDDDDIILRSRKGDQVRKIITEKLHNNGAPLISVVEASSGTLVLEHDPHDEMPLDPKYAKETMKYVRAVWKNKVVLKTKDRYGRPFEYRATIDGVSMIDTNGNILDSGEEEEEEADNQGSP